MEQRTSKFPGEFRSLLPDALWTSTMWWIFKLRSGYFFPHNSHLLPTASLILLCLAEVSACRVLSASVLSSKIEGVINLVLQSVYFLLFLGPEPMRFSNIFSDCPFFLPSPVSHFLIVPLRVLGSRAIVLHRWQLHVTIYIRGGVFGEIIYRFIGSP